MLRTEPHVQEKVESDMHQAGAKVARKLTCTKPIAVALISIRQYLSFVFGHFIVSLLCIWIMSDCFPKVVTVQLVDSHIYVGKMVIVSHDLF